MLVEFSVENYRIFRDKQIFTMATSKSSLNKSETSSSLNTVVRTDFKAAPYLLKQSCIFGANGAGKSTLVEAMRFMSRLVKDSIRDPNRKEINIDSFGIDEQASQKPSCFEVVFIHQNTLYQYGFSITSERVEEEWLVARSLSTQRLRQYFHRDYDKESDSYHWEVNSLLIPKEKGYWRKITRPTALFLSTAVQFEESGLDDVFDWIGFHFRFIFMAYGMNPDVTASFLEQVGWKQRILNYFESVGISLYDISITEINYFETKEYKGLPPAVQEQIRMERRTDTTYVINFIRKRDDEKVLSLLFKEESFGIRAIFELAGPILDTLNKGYTLVIDEFNSNLHPLAFREIILMFSNPKINVKNAQLIFSSHDVTVTEYEEIGRDQIWLLEKKPDLASELYPLSNFKGRRGKLFRNDYLRGRYGGIPLII